MPTSGVTSLQWALVYRNVNGPPSSVSISWQRFCFFLKFISNFTLQWGCRRRYFSSIFSPTSLFKGVVVVDILKMSNFIFRRSVVVVAFFLIFVKRPNQGPLFLVGPGAAAPPAPMVVTPLTPTKFCQKLLLADFLTCHTKGRRLVSKQAYQF